MSTADDKFIRQFGIVLVLLAIFTVAMIWLANGIGGPAMDQARNSPSVVAERIARVGMVRFEGDEAPVAEAAAETIAAAAPAAGGIDGEAVYNTACLACHASGAAGAPMLGDEAAWTARVEQGMDTLVAHAINGKGTMPAKGGNPNLSDEEVRAAVEWMVDQTGLMVAGAAPAAAEETAATKEAAATQAPVATEQPAAPQEPAPTEQAAATEEPVKSTNAAAETAPAGEAETTAGAAAPDGKPGGEVYAMACLACHLSGAAGAPKTGDNGEWAKRYKQGLDALVHNALNGKGIMPAKGGMPNLTEGDIHNAVVHMLKESGIDPS